MAMIRLVPIVLLLSAEVASAQVPAQQPATPPPNYQYAADGRRDPFVNLINRGEDSGAKAVPKVRPEGIAGVLVEEVVVKGLFQNRGTWIAMIQAPNGRTYSVKPGDRLFDGSIQTITPQAVILMQDVSDPLKLAKQREVRKYLRGEVK